MRRKNKSLIVILAAVLLGAVGASRLLGAAGRISDEIGGGPTRERIPVWPEAEDEARRALGNEEYESFRAEGYGMTLERAVSYGLNETILTADGLNGQPEGEASAR